MIDNNLSLDVKSIFRELGMNPDEQSHAYMLEQIGLKPQATHCKCAETLIEETNGVKTPNRRVTMPKYHSCEHIRSYNIVFHRNYIAFMEAQQLKAEKEQSNATSPQR